MMTSNSFKKRFTMMILKQMFLNDGTKSLMVSKQFRKLQYNTTKFKKVP